MVFGRDNLDVLIALIIFSSKTAFDSGSWTLMFPFVTIKDYHKSKVNICISIHDYVRPNNDH